MAEYRALVDADGRLQEAGPATPVPWWSFTKTLIAAAVLRLAEQRRLVLDTALEGLPYTPRQVLQHRAGIGDYGGLPAYHEAVARGHAPWSREAFQARVPPGRLASPPGSQFAYSNPGYALLRDLVERHTGLGFGPALRALVLDPLELPTAAVLESPADMAATAFPGPPGYHPGWVAHGLAAGPVAEAALALHGLLRGPLLSVKSRAAMRQAVPVGGALPGRPWLETGYGLGLMIGPAEGLGLIEGHSAGGPGSVGAVYHAPSTGRTAAVFCPGEAEGVAEWAALRLLAG